MNERIIIEGRQAVLQDGEGDRHVAELGSFLGRVSEHCLHGMTEEPIPGNVKWMVSCGTVDVCIVEFEPELRLLNWITDDSPAPYGPEAMCTPRRLATPYVVLKVPLRRGRIVTRVELFYRNEPLGHKSGPGGSLFWPNLLNVSPGHKGCTAWLCTQFFSRLQIRPGITAGLDALTHHLWGGNFNRSSEAHEGASAFSKARADGIDSRVTDVGRWEAESVKDPYFVLSVDWRPTGMDVQSVIEAELRAQRVPPAPASASSLANHLLRTAKP